METTRNKVISLYEKQEHLVEHVFKYGNSNGN